MKGFDRGFSDGNITRINNTYQAWVELTDSHLQAYNPDRDDIPKHILRQYGWETEGFIEKMVRYNLVDQPAAGTSPTPYNAILEKASVIAFQKIEPEAEMPSLPTLRKVEFLDPFRALGGTTLMMILLADKDEQTPVIPEISVTNYEADGLRANRLPPKPFYDVDLTDNMLHLAAAIKELSEADKLTPIGVEDFQAMSRLHADLETQ